jgi:cell division protein FtsB
MSEVIQFNIFTVYLTLCQDHIFVRLYENIKEEKYELKISNSNEFGLYIENISINDFFSILIKCFKKETGHVVCMTVYKERIVAKFDISLYGIFKFDFEITFNRVNVDNSMKEDVQKLKDENEYLILSNQNFKEEIKDLKKQIEICINKLDDLSVNMSDNVLIGYRFGNPVFTHKNKEIDLIGKVGYGSDLYIDCVRVLRFPVKIDFDIIHKNNISIYIDGNKIYHEKEGLNDKEIVIDFLKKYGKIMYN